MSFFNWYRSQKTNDHEELETQLNVLNNYALYNLKEITKDGTIITHMTSLRKKSVIRYCKMIWLEDYPATFIFETVFKDFTNAI